ncbi:DUF2927 domain-containing protein [Pseudomonadota bacterium]
MLRLCFKSVLSLLCPLMMGLAASGASAKELRPQLDDMVDHFVQVTLGREYNTGAGPRGAIKWQAASVGIAVQGKLATKTMVDMASAHVRTITRLTGVKFRQIKPGTPGPSIDLIFLKRAEMGQLRLPNTDPAVLREMTDDPRTVCVFLTWDVPPGEIVRAVVVVNAEADPARMNSCLLEELTQVMGLPNDVDAYWRSIFNPNDTGTAHSPWDRLYLKTLYDPRMKPGMNEAQMRAVAREIFAAALSGGTL